MTGPYAESVLRQIIAAAPLERRRRRTRLGAAMVAAISAITGSVLVFLPSPASADIEVTVRDGVVEVRVTDLDATPGDVLDALREHGLDAQVSGAPVGPSNVGRFVLVTVVGGSPGQVRASGDGGSFDSFEIDDEWTGVLTISIGEAAASGVAYDKPSDPFAAREPFHCAGVFGRRLADIRGAVEGFHVEVQASDNGLLGPRLSFLDAAARHPTAVVTGGWGFAADSVLFTVEPGPTREESGC